MIPTYPKCHDCQDTGTTAWLRPCTCGAAAPTTLANAIQTVRDERAKLAALETSWNESIAEMRRAGKVRATKHVKARAAAFRYQASLVRMAEAELVRIALSETP